MQVNNECSYKTTKRSLKECICKLPIFENGKCILHCEKDSWVINHSPFVDFDSEKQREFWLKFKEDCHWRHNIYGIVFPKMCEPLFVYSGSRTEKIFDTVEITFHSCVFLGDMSFPNTKKLEFINCKFYQSLQISNSSEEIIFSRCPKVKDLTFYPLSPQTPEKIKLKLLKLESSHFENLFLNNFEIDDFSVKQVYVNDFRILDGYITNKMEFDDVNHREHILEHGDLFWLNNVSFTKDSEVKIERFYFKRFEINSIREQPNSFKIITSSGMEKFIFRNSNLTNFYFQNLNLSDTEIEFTSCNLIEEKHSIFIQILWSNKIVAHRDILSQFKSIFQKTGNNSEANRFYLLEMKSQKNELDYEIKDRSKGKVLKTLFYKLSSKEYLLLAITERTSNFFQNWLMPLILLFLSSIIIYFTHHLILNLNIPNFGLDNFDTLKVFFLDYFRYINPLETSPRNPFILWILLRLLFYPYFLYHFVTSVKIKLQTK